MPDDQDQSREEQATDLASGVEAGLEAECDIGPDATGWQLLGKQIGSVAMIGWLGITGRLGQAGEEAGRMARRGECVEVAGLTDDAGLSAWGEDYSEEDESWQILTDIGDLDAVTSALEEADIKVESSTVGYVPKAKKPLQGKEAERCLSLYETLDDHDDTQGAYADFDVSDDELARIMGD